MHPTAPERKAYSPGITNEGSQPLGLELGTANNIIKRSLGSTIGSKKERGVTLKVLGTGSEGGDSDKLGRAGTFAIGRFLQQGVRGLVQGEGTTCVHVEHLPQILELDVLYAGENVRYTRISYDDVEMVNSLSLNRLHGRLGI